MYYYKKELKSKVYYDKEGTPITLNIEYYEGPFVSIYHLIDSLFPQEIGFTPSKVLYLPELM